MYDDPAKVFFASGHPGVTAEILGRSPIVEFDARDHKVTVPFVSTVDKAKRTARSIAATARTQESLPIVARRLRHPHHGGRARGAAGDPELPGMRAPAFEALAGRIPDATHPERRTTS